jgi:hypothetical protein
MSSKKTGKKNLLFLGIMLCMVVLFNYLKINDCYMNDYFKFVLFNKDTLNYKSINTRVTKIENYL